MQKKFRMKHIKKALDETNWDLMKKQKLALIEKSKNNKDIRGILNFLDVLQDAVVDDGLVTEKEMFNIEE